jgi:uncharacterized YkwD family protein
MIRKKLTIILTSILLVMLVACNNTNQDAATNRGQNNGQTTQLNAQNTADNYVSNVNQRFTNEADDRNFTNYQDDETNANRINNRENVTNNNRLNTRDNRGDDNRFLGRDNRNNDNRFNQQANNEDFEFGRNVNNDVFIEHDLENPGSNISADATTISSNKYPHTKAVLIQEAKYKHVKTDGQNVNLQGLKEQGQNQLRDLAAQYGTRQNQQGTKKGAQGQNANQQQTAQQGTVNTQNQKQAQAQNQQQQNTQTQQAVPKAQDTTQNQATAPTQQQDTAQAKPEQQTEKAGQAAAGNTAINEFESKVIELTNAERRKNGLKDLTGDNSLSNVAREKSTDMQKNNYFSHTSPTYGSPFDMMRDFGITYNTAGENIAQGQRTPEEVVQAWMNSEGHRKNILSDKFTHIGVGYQQNGHHWTQMFVGR